jgi:hypothetical protein
MPYFRYAHLIYAMLFALCALTFLRLGTSPVFSAGLVVILVVWLASAAGWFFRAKWAWTGSFISMASVWLLLVVNLAKSIGTRPGHEDWLKDIVLLTVCGLLPVTLGIVSLFRMRNFD